MTNIRELITTHSKAEKVLKLAGEVGSNLGKQVYVVGGFVRDIFMQKISKEIDLMVVGDGINFAEALAKRLAVKKIIPFKEFSNFCICGPCVNRSLLSTAITALTSSESMYCLP